MERMIGTVRYESSFGFGFIVAADGGRFYFTENVMLNPRIEVGDLVTFQRLETPRGLRAIDVQRLPAAGADVERWHTTDKETVR